jgi:hypothetical protein
MNSSSTQWSFSIKYFSSGNSMCIYERWCDIKLTNCKGMKIAKGLRWELTKLYYTVPTIKAGGFLLSAGFLSMF